MAAQIMPAQGLRLVLGACSSLLQVAIGGGSPLAQLPPKPSPQLHDITRCACCFASVIISLPRPRL